MKLRIDSRTILYFILIIIAGSGFFFTLIMPSPEGFYAFIAVAAFAGFCVSANIYDTKQSGKQLVCPTGSDCNAVVNSRYAKFFGISLEKWGMAYFAFISFAYLAMIFSRELFSNNMVTVLVFLSIAAGFFSLYLLFIQAFVLRKWCMWCILTAMISLTICVTSLVSADIAVEFIYATQSFVLMLKYLGFAFGVGGSTAAIFLFNHFLEDASIDAKELSSIKEVFELIWVGFVLVMVSQFAFLVAYPDMLIQSNIFIIQIVALLIFAFSAAVLMIVYAPFLVYVPFKKTSKKSSDYNFLALRSPTITFGGIALMSWYFAFVINFIPEISFGSLVVIFMALFSMTVLAAAVWDNGLRSKVVRESPTQK